MSKATVIIMLALMNAARPDTPLEAAADLNERAQRRAETFCGRSLSHDGWQGYFEGTPYRVMGENLAKGHESAEAAFKALMTSPNHRANILNKDYTRVGIGEACGVIVQFFGG